VTRRAVRFVKRLAAHEDILGCELTRELCEPAAPLTDGATARRRALTCAAATSGRAALWGASAVASGRLFRRLAGWRRVLS
jgi:hypothetical protein